MLRIQYKSIQTAFQYPFRTAYGVKTHQPALLIALSMNGITGFGESPPVAYYNVTVDGMIEEMVRKIQILERYAFTEPDRFWHFCHHLFPDNHFLICALDMAYWDMYAKVKRKTMQQLFNLPDSLKVEKEPLTDYTIGIDEIDIMLQKMKANPWPIYKIKLGSKSDISIIEALRMETDAVFRVDANAGWRLEEALEIIPILHANGVELVEQPLAKDNWEDMQILFEKSVLPIFADESCVGEGSIDACLNCFHGINIKLTKCGGITPAIRMIEKAKSKGKMVMMGCMSETEIGSYAIAQFLPWLNFVDMDGPLLLKDVQLKKMKYDFGKITLLE